MYGDINNSVPAHEKDRNFTGRSDRKGLGTHPRRICVLYRKQKICSCRGEVCQRGDGACACNHDFIDGGMGVTVYVSRKEDCETADRKNSTRFRKGLVDRSGYNNSEGVLMM